MKIDIMERSIKFWTEFGLPMIGIMCSAIIAVIIMIYIIALLTNTLPQKGFTTQIGTVSNIDTSDWSQGDKIYSDPNTPGALTNKKPKS